MIVASFNIRYDESKDGIHSLANRKEQISEVLRDNAPDVIGFQEVEPATRAWLQDTLDSYIFVGSGRNKMLMDEGNPIAFKKSRFNLLEMGSFWLSSTPYRPGSRFLFQSICPRICNYVLLHDLESLNTFYVFNTHLDHVSQSARLNGIKQIIKKINARKLYPDAPYIILGDFNAFPESQEIKYLTEKLELSDLTAGIENTFHNFGKYTDGHKIDYIFASGDIESQEVGIWTSSIDNLYLSDHHLIYTKIFTRGDKL